MALVRLSIRSEKLTWQQTTVFRSLSTRKYLPVTPTSLAGDLGEKGRGYNECGRGARNGAEAQMEPVQVTVLLQQQVKRSQSIR